MPIVVLVEITVELIKVLRLFLSSVDSMFIPESFEIWGQRLRRKVYGGFELNGCGDEACNLQ
ncbi:hypothetical protein NI389_08405 [Pseudoalteromonas xiamenensis]|uniref:hypothetical protein n=1 Tax=Pseudoalteromonas xiamenensis TaxID=882626 RepID=UPI0027E58B66|nr:hypothetical protein [Pseudoalteromonas xiamenensis]WMN61388.1 hypothetical protein NI389_08405 [Pseudoalteromonas xiamenensis]